MADAAAKILNRRRGTLKTKITRLSHYVKGESIGTDDVIVIDAKYKTLQDIKNQLDGLRIEYFEVLEDSAVPEMEKTFDGMEEDLENLEVSLLKFKSLKSKKPSCEGNIDKTMKVKLPDISLPKFSGNIEDWNNFKIQFNSLISANDDLDDSHKLYYLQSALIGNARQIQTTEDTFSSLFKALTERYEHKRLIVNTHINELINLEKIHHESAVELRNLIDTVIKHVRALKSLKLDMDQLSANILVNIVLQKVDKESRKLFEMSLKNDELPEWEQLIEFLKKRCQFLENLQGHAAQVKPKSLVKFKSLLVDSNVNSSNCIVCKSRYHPIYKCPEFLKSSVKQRFFLIKKHSLCLKCFQPSHRVIDCRSKYGCNYCDNPHNTLLHDPSKHEENKIKNKGETAESVKSDSMGRREEKNDREPRPSYKQTELDSVCTSHLGSDEKTILLATAVIYMTDALGKRHPLRCLLDSGSMINALTRESANLLNLREEKRNVPISGLNGTIIPAKSKMCVEVSNSNYDFVKVSEFVIIAKITNVTPARHLDINIGGFSKNITFADPSFFKPGRIDALIGVELFFEMLKSGKIYMEDSRIILQDTVFGYIVTGSTARDNTVSENYCGLLRDSTCIDDTLRAFWEIESINESTPMLSPEEMECERHFLETYGRAPDGRYVVKMPLKSDKVLGESKTMASNRLDSLWRRLQRDHKMQSLYTDFIQEYLELGHMVEVSDDQEPDGCYYFPHHGVFRPDKTSTKLRVVFNGSAATSTGVSLNQLQRNGKIPQQDLFSIMIRFRKHAYVFTADIRMMYRQILIHPTQRDLQRIIWKEGPTKPVKTYQLCTVTYGTKNAPYLATRALKQLCEDEQELFPQAAAVAQEDFYIDDILTGCHDFETTKKLQSHLVELLERGKMTLHKWSSNDVRLLNNVSNNEHYTFDTQDDTKPVKVLGVIWQPDRDCLSYKVSIQHRSNYTKRTVLSDISRIFDPLGLLGPVVTRAKVFLQNLWLLHLGWDTPLPDAFVEKWQNFVSQLPSIDSLVIPRQFPNDGTVTLHGFADASTTAYGAAIYAQWKSPSGTMSVHLLCSKSRIAPIKPVTIPRLELCAALLLSQLIHKVVKALAMKHCIVVLWSDSTIVLAWLKKSPHELKTFVSNRVAAIQELTNDFQWRHIPSKSNPADLVSRGLAPDQIQDNELWWTGPTIIRENIDFVENCALESVKDNSDYTCEFKQPVDISLPSTVNNSMLSYISSITNNYVKLIKVVSFIYRFVNNAKGSTPLSGPISGNEIKQAENVILRLVQQCEFQEEYRNIKQGKPISGKSPLKSLNPFIDEDDIMRVGGRLHNSKVSFDNKHQIILPAKSKLTCLILEHLHKKHLHIGPQALLYYSRQRFWPINGRNLSRKIVQNCVTCVKNKPVTVEQLMGNPPKERVTMSSPFTHTGVDFTGPFFIKYRNQRKGTLHKVYVAIFVCMATKAIHIEMVSDLTTDAFIAALKRFFARRGKCSTLFSDNATNFVGAHAELKRLHKLVRYPDEVLGNFLASDKINWNFIPPGAPNFGGLWEAGVKSFKHHLKRAVGNANLNYEEFNTIITEIEGILNSRPLTPISSDINDLEALSPGHFLIGRPITTIMDRDFTEIPDNRLARWHRVEKLTQTIWKRWRLDYLSHFQQRQKWQFLKDNVKPGMMVVLREDNLPKCKWALGRIVDVIPGTDGCIRVVNVRTAHGILKRPVSKLSILPVDFEN